MTSTEITSRDPLGAAVVGLGIGQAHARSYVDSARAALKTIYDIDPAKVRESATEFPGVETPGSYSEILSDPEIDIISIATYDDAHSSQVIEALKAGKHVFVEKPLCRSGVELEEIRREWEARPHLFLGANLVLRAAPLYVWLRDTVRSGEFGDVFAFDGDYLYGRVEKITEGWRGKIEGYSVMQGGGVHMVDLMTWITGEVPSEATARGNHIATTGTGFMENDYAAATFAFPSGMIGRITANFGCVHPHQHHVRVYGTKATFIYDDQGARIHRGRDAKPEIEKLSLSPLPKTKGDLIDPILRKIQEGVEFEKDVQHEFDVMQVCFAADRALASGTAERIGQS